MSRHNANLTKLADIIKAQHELLMQRWRERARQVPAVRRLNVIQLDDHIRLLLDEISDALIADEKKSMMKLDVNGGASDHGLERLRQDFNLMEIVAEYNALREVINEFAEANGVRLGGQVTAVVNRVLDKAVATAVQTYSEQKALEIQKHREEHLSFIVHDLKTPLSAIATATNILDQALPYSCKDERVSRMMTLVHRNTRRLNALLSRVLQESANLEAATGDVGYPARIERREFDLWPLVEELIHDLQPLVESSETQMRNEVPPDITVFADPVLLTQVFQNLISNAIDYTKQGEIVVGAISEGEGVRCWVRDTGEGIPSERIGKIFDKLETDPRKKGGLGLGLTLVKQIVEAHGGEITVSSTPGAGSSFEFYLPAYVSAERAS